MSQGNITELARLLAPILRKYGIRSASIFGSTARGEDTEASDLDLLVEYPEGMGFFQLLDLYEELERAVGRKVEMVAPKYLKPRLREHVSRSQIRIL